MIKWWKVIREGLEFLRALLAALKKKETKNGDSSGGPDSKVFGHRITRSTVDAQIRHQRELFKKNHPKG